MVSAVNRLAGAHTQGVERPVEDARVRFCHPQGGAHRHNLEVVGHTQAFEFLRQRVVPVAHRRQRVARAPQSFQGRAGVRQQNELQTVHQTPGENVQGRGTLPQPLTQNRGAAPAQVGQRHGIAALIQMFAIEAHLGAKGIGHQRFGVVETLRPQAPRKPGNGRVEAHEGSKSVDKNGGRHGQRTVTEPRRSRPGRNPSYTSSGVLALSANNAGRPRRTRLALAALPAAVAVAWAPSFVAEIYDTDGQGGTVTENYLTRPDRGWVFLADAVQLSRGARLGTAEDALDLARTEVWTGPPVEPTKVDLIYGGDPFRVAVPDGGTAPPAERAVAQPESGLSWLVTGTVRNGPEQPIGLIDYASKRVVWNIRPLAEPAP